MEARLNEILVIEIIADVVKLVDTLDLGSSAVRCVGSTPSIRTYLKDGIR